MAKNIICGRNAILEVFNNKPGIIKKIYLNNAAKSFFKQENSEIFKFHIEIVDSKKLEELATSDSHQGVVAEVERVNLISFKELLLKLQNREFKKIVALDSLQDAQNFGAILRSAEFFGVDAVLWSSSRSISLSPVVSKISMGASELVTLVDVGNLGDSLLKIKEAGFWTVLADVDEDAQSINNYSFPENTCLVLGQEGSGASNRIKKICDESVFIERRGRLESLNVSNASALFFYKLFN